LIPAGRCLPLTFAELRKAKSVECIGIMIFCFVPMSDIARCGDERACGNCHTIRKCEWAQRKTSQGDWEGARLTSAFLSRDREYNEQRPRPSTRWVSLRKLSILCILSTPAFVHPSSLITASTSWRSGSKYSGWARRRYNTCMSVCWHATIRLHYGRRQDDSTCQGRRMNGRKIGYE
jgi:hypothetical protein